MLEKLNRYKDIIAYRTLAHLKSESRQNYLGYFWFLMEPALATGILYFIFGILLNNKSGEFVVFLLIGMAIWQWFEASTIEGMVGLKSKLHIMQHIRLPKYIFPMVHIAVSTCKFCFVGVIVIVFAYLFGFPPNKMFIYIPLLVLIQLLLILGITLPLAVLSAYFGDTNKLVASLLRLLFYVSGIFFSTDIVPDSLKFYFYMNPIAGLIEGHRKIILEQSPPNFNLLLYAFVFGLITFSLGLFICKAVDKKLLKDVPYERA